MIRGEAIGAPPVLEQFEVPIRAALPPLPPAPPCRVDQEVEDGDVPGVVVARVNLSTRFMHELLDAMNDAYSKWSSRENIRNLPETTDGGDS